MAYFAELDSTNVVLRVLSISNKALLDKNGTEIEQRGIDYCKKLFGPDTMWKQTSYNTRGGVHSEGKTPFRKNYAGIGFVYDPDRDAFLPPRPPGDHWELDEVTGCWYDPLYNPIDIGVSRV